MKIKQKQPSCPRVKTTHQQDIRDPLTTQTNSTNEPGQYIFSGFHNYFCQQQNTGGSGVVQDSQNIMVMVLSAPV